MADELSAAELQQLKEIAKSLPAGHPALNKVNLLLNSQPTQFEKERPGGGTTQGAPLEHGGYKEPSATAGAGTAAVTKLKQMLPSDPTGGRSVLDPKAWYNPDEASFDPMHGGLAEAGREAKAGFRREGASGTRFDTLSRIGGAISSGLGSLVGVSGREQAEHAARGETGKIIGETAAPAGVALLSYAGPKMLPKIGPTQAVLNMAERQPALTRLAFGYDRAAALRELAAGRDTPTLKPIGASLPSAEDFYEHKGADIMRRGAAEERLARARERATPKIEPIQPELGSPENPGFHSKLPTRMPKQIQAPTEVAKPEPFPGAVSSARPIGNAQLPPVGSVQLPKVIPQAEPITAIDVPSEEGVRGSLPKPSGRLVLLPEEARAVDRLQGIAKRRASEHGTLYAAGMRPAGGGRVPFTPTGTTTSEFGGPRTLQPIEQPAPKQLSAPKERPQITYKGGINEKGVEESIRPISHEQSVSGLSGEIERMKEKLRNANGASESEKSALQRQIDEYQGRLDELRKAKK